MKRRTVRIEIASRAWYEWLAWLVWLLLVVFVFQNAVASGREYESSAAAIFWATEVVLLIGGGIIWYLRSQKPAN